MYKRPRIKEIYPVYRLDQEHFRIGAQIGITKELGLASFIGLCSVSLNKSVLPSLAVLGNISIGGSINRIENLADTLQVCLDSGAKKVLLPMSASVDFGSVPAELLSKFTLLFYNDPIDAVKKALGVE